MDDVVEKILEGYEMKFNGDNKKIYQPPKLEGYGDVRDVTLSFSGGGSDSFFGEDDTFIP